MADEEQEITISYEDVTTNLTELLTNSVNMVDKFYEIFFDTNPHIVELEMYDKEGVIVTRKIPNRAMDRSVAYSGVGSPEDILEAYLGALYIDVEKRQLYIKQTAESKIGWQNITPQPIKTYNEMFTVDHTVSSIVVSHMVDDNNPPKVYLNGLLLSPNNYIIGTDKRTISLLDTLSDDSLIQVEYIVGLYGLKGETALTCKVGNTETLAPYTPAYVKNVGTEKDLILDFGLPVGPLEWGNITGTLSNQTDLKNALDAKQHNLTAGNHITINNNVISAVDKWGGITGTLNDQTDLKNEFSKKQNNLTAGANISIENDVISVTGDLGTQVTMKIWED